MPLPKKGVAYTFTRALYSTAVPGAFQVNPTIAVGDFRVSTDGGALVNLTTLPVVAPAGSVLVQITVTAAEMTADRVSVVGIDQAGNEWGPLHESFDTSAVTLEDVAAYIDTEVAAIKAKTDQLTFTNANTVNAALLAAADLATAVGQKVADIVLRRVAANIEGSANGDALATASLYGLLMRAEHSDTTTHPGQQTIYRSNGVTELGQVALALDDTAQDITGFGG